MKVVLIYAWLKSRGATTSLKGKTRRGLGGLPVEFVRGEYKNLKDKNHRAMFWGQAVPCQYPYLNQ